MKKIATENEKGFAIILALMMLLVLTLIGISAISTTSFENNISGNERVGIDAFYASEALVQVGLNQLPNTDAIPERQIGEDSHGWSGAAADKGAPTASRDLGPWIEEGFSAETGSPFSFRIFQVKGTGESFGAIKETEVQASAIVPSGY